MAIALDSVSTAYTEQVGSKTFSHTISAAADQVLVVGIEIPHNDDKVTGITFNGVALTRTYSYLWNTASTYLYHLVAPAAGTHDIVVSFATAVEAVIIAGAFSGVNQATPIAATNGADAQGTGPTNISIATPSGGVAIAMIGTGAQTSDPFILGDGQTPVGQLTNGVSASARGSMSYKADATVMSSTWAQYRAWTASVLALAPVAAVDTLPPTATAAAVANATPTFIDITFSEAMNTAFTPAASTVTASGHTVTALAYQSATVLRATVSAAYVNGEAASTLAYTQNGTNNLRDAAGNLLLNFTGRAITNNAVAAPVAATAIAVSGPTTGTVGVASSSFTVSANGAITGTVVITPAATGCTFTPATVNISSGTPTATFACTAAAAGAKSITVTNNGGLTNPTALTYTASAASAGTFVTDTWTNNAETLRASEAFTGTWYAGGAIGTTGGAATLVSGTLSAGGVATVTGLPAGAGFFLGKSADGGVFYQAGTVA